MCVIGMSLYDYVSIHTPTQGVTALDAAKLAKTRFNPHTHAGCDFRPLCPFNPCHCFNPHTHAGCDALDPVPLDGNLVSIHTPTQGVTCSKKGSSPKECFNPHTHAGCDLRESECRGELFVSIHTPTQGVTPPCIQLSKTEESFNPHTHAGCDGHYLQGVCRPVVSIHTPTQGVTFFVRN